jgi:hypothetical protein
MLALVAATPANAGTASVSVEGDKVTLAYVANGGETNTVTVTQSAGSFAVADATADVTPGAGCVAGATARRATCADPNTLGAIQAIRVDLLDLDDVVDIDAQVASTLLGRTGMDDLMGGDGNDVVNGGGDADSVNVRGPGKDSVQCEPGETVFSDPVGDTVTGLCTNDVAPSATITGPAATNDNTPSFTFSSPDTGVTFDCMVDPIDTHFSDCGTPYEETRELADGPYTIRAQASDGAPGPGPPATHSFVVDTQAPQVIVTGPPSGNSAQPTFQFSSNEAISTFECAIDQAGFAPCSSTYTTPPLANGTYVLFVRGTDAAGNSTTTEFPFGVDVTAGGGGGGGTTPPAVQPRRIIIESLVLISGRPVRMSRKGVVSISLQCAGTKTCKGRMSITTAEPVKRKSRKLETLGSTKFSIAANKKKNVRVRFSKRKRKLAKRLKRFKAKVVIREVDQRGNARISSRVFILRAR